MFHSLASATSWLLVPSSWLLVLQLCALWNLLMGRVARARWLFTITVIALVAVQFPVADLLMQPLEQAFAAPALPERVDGIVLMAGSERPRLMHAYGKPHFSEDSERATEFIALARRFPEARYVYTGQPSEAEVFRTFLASQGFDAGRVSFEQGSKDTYESALHTHSLVKPRAGEVWLLVTSAGHMPRAHGAFSKAGWDVIAYPVAYRALPQLTWGYTAPDTLDVAIHEWIGIAAYKLAGRM